MDKYLGNAIIGLLGGAFIGFSGYIKAKEKFNLGKFSLTVGISTVGGLALALMGFDPWMMDANSINAVVVGEGGFLGTATYVLQALGKYFQPSKKK
jgi:hypothetical protein